MFCSKCGSKLADGASFCSHCGEKIGAAVESDSQEVSLTFDRKSQPYLINPPIKVSIDGIPRLGVDNGKVETLSVSVGVHKIELSASLRTKTLEVDVRKDTVITIGFNRLSGAITADVK